MLAILNSLNAHNLPIFQPILMNLVSKFMVHRALSDKMHLLLGLLSPLNRTFCKQTVETLIRCFAASDLGLHCLSMTYKKTPGLSGLIRLYIFNKK